ncbi:hypothetical protein BDV10DRAFT_190054 [Aspergillus recurvatus]
MLSSKVHDELRQSEHISPQDTIQSSSTQEIWRFGDYASNVLLADNNGLVPSDRRCLLLLHMVYLESHVLLNERFIRRYSQNEILKSAPTSPSYSSSPISSRSSTRIKAASHASCHSCTTPLLGLCLALWNSGTEIETTLVSDMQQHAEKCLQMLQHCGIRSTAAGQLWNSLSPLLGQLKTLIQRRMRIESARLESMQMQAVLDRERERGSPSVRAELQALAAQIIQRIEYLRSEDSMVFQP